MNPYSSRSGTYSWVFDRTVTPPRAGCTGKHGFSVSDVPAGLIAAGGGGDTVGVTIERLSAEAFGPLVKILAVVSFTGVPVSSSKWANVFQYQASLADYYKENGAVPPTRTRSFEVLSVDIGVGLGVAAGVAPPDFPAPGAPGDWKVRVFWTDGAYSIPGGEVYENVNTYTGVFSVGVAYGETAWIEYDPALTSKKLPRAIGLNADGFGNGPASLGLGPFLNTLLKDRLILQLQNNNAGTAIRPGNLAVLIWGFEAA